MIYVEFFRVISVETVLSFWVALLLYLLLNLTCFFKMEGCFLKNLQRYQTNGFEGHQRKTGKQRLAELLMKEEMLYFYFFLTDVC